MLCSENGLLRQYTQDVGSEIGIGSLTFDLNKVVPAVLHWLVGDTDTAYDLVGTYTGDVYDNNVPKFTNIYYADKAIYNAHLNGGLAKTLKKSGTDADVATGVDELVTELATFAMDAVDEYLEEHSDDKRYGGDYTADTTVTQKGLNNIFVALPQVLDIMGKNFAKKYNVDSDWTYVYDGKITTIEKTFRDGTVTQLQNTTLQAFKDTATTGKQSVLNEFVDIFVGNWIDAILDLVNDVVSDKNNDISSDLSLVQGLLEALGGFDDDSIITDVVNGFFQLTRADDASFTLTKQDSTGFVGFSNTSGFFLISNIFYKDGKTSKGIIPFITSLTSKSTSKTKTSSTTSSTGSNLTMALASSKKSAAGTVYSELLTKENEEAAQKLIDKLDEVLASLLENTSINGFDLSSNNSVISGAVTLVANYLGTDNTNELINILNDYLDCFCQYNKTGPVNEKTLYSSKNLSNIVIETYALVEDIVDYLLDSALNGKDSNGLIAGAITGIISPDAVGVRMDSKYSKVTKTLLSKNVLTWNDLKDTKDLKYGFTAGNKDDFYEAFGESFNGIATVVGFLLTSIVANDGTNLYSGVLQPIYSNLAKATGASGVMSASKFNSATDGQKLVKGVLAPIANIIGTMYDAPATFIINLVQGLAGILEDKQINSILDNVSAIVSDTVSGLLDGVTSLLNEMECPTLAKLVQNAIDKSDLKLPINISDLLGLASKNTSISLINTLLGKIKISGVSIGSYIKLPNVNWSKLNKASDADALLLIYGYVVDTILGSNILTSLLDSAADGLSDILKDLSAAQVLTILVEILDIAKTPTEIYWSFNEYASKLTGKFTYPRTISDDEANTAVDQLDSIVDNIFPLLEAFGIDIGDDLSSIVNDNLYTNELLTTLAKLIYGNLDSLANGIGIDTFSTKGFAEILTDKSYGRTFTSAAATLKKAKSWDSVTKLNWGFTNGSSKAEQGFINGVAAILRPLDNILAVLLADAPIEADLDADKDLIVELINSIDSGSTSFDIGSTTCTLKYAVKNSVVTLTIKSSMKNSKSSTIKFNVGNIIDTLFDNIENQAIYLGSNAYESAVVPLLEAFMCDGVKTLKQYQSDIKKASDNVIIDILNPIFGFVDDVVESPFDTIAGVLPNLAYFIDSNGLMQAVGNLLAPITSSKGIIGVLKDNGIDIDDIIETVLGKDLGSYLTDLIGISDVKLTLELTDLSTCNIQDIVIPLVNSLISSYGIVIPDIDWSYLASLGSLKYVKSAAKNDEGKYQTRQVIANKGKVLVAVLRYLAQTIIDNAKAIKNIILNIDAVKNNDTISSVVKSIFNQLANASKDDIVRAIFYFLTGEATDSYYDYTGYTSKNYSFSYGDIDATFMAQFAQQLDASIENIWPLLTELGVANIENLNAVVSDGLYTDSLVSTIATGLYGAIEGVKISDSLGTLTDVLALTDIDFSTSNVAKLLTDSDYGKTYASAAKAIKSAGSWKNVKASKLSWGVKDRDSFLNALCAVLRPIYGVVDVLFGDGTLNLFNLVSIPGSNGYESAIAPLLEALGVEGLKTMSQINKDKQKAYDNMLLDVLNPVFDWLEDLLDSPIEKLASILPSIGLFIANDGIIQVINNLLTPVSALLDAVKPIVDVNDILSALGVEKTLNKTLAKVGIDSISLDVYNLKKTLKPIIGQSKIVPLINAVLGSINISGISLADIQLPTIDWFELASHGDVETVKSCAKNSEGKYTRETVDANIGETLLAVLRYIEKTVIKNAKAINKLIQSIDSIKKNSTLSKILALILNTISNDQQDDLLKAIFYFFEGRCTDSFFDFSNFTTGDGNYEFNWGQLDSEFCLTLPPMLDGLITGLLEDKGGLLGLIEGLVYSDDIINSLATGLYGAIEGVTVGSLGSLTDILALTDIDFSTSNVAALLTDESYGQTYAANAAVIKAAGSWKNVNTAKLSWGVTDRDSFVHALCAVLRPIYGVLDVLLNDGLLNLFNIASVPGSDGYTSTIVPLLETFSCYNIKTQYQYREDMSKEYDAILIDILNPLLDKVEDLLNAPLEVLTSMLPNLALVFANDGLIQIIDNLLTPVSALLEALKPIVNVNELLTTLGVDVNKLLANAGLNLNINLDIYDLPATLEPVIGSANVVSLLNNILSIIKISGNPLGLVLPEVDWYQLASHGDLITNGSSQVATIGSRIYVNAETSEYEGETLIAVLRFLIDTVNYQDNYNTIVNLITGLLGDNISSGVTDTINTVLKLLKGDSDSVIESLVELLESFA
jgi:hypothetical protein